MKFCENFTIIFVYCSFSLGPCINISDEAAAVYPGILLGFVICVHVQFHCCIYTVLDALQCEQHVHLFILSHINERVLLYSDVMSF